jgi:hypothetical protein
MRRWKLSILPRFTPAMSSVLESILATPFEATASAGWSMNAVQPSFWRHTRDPLSGRAFEYGAAHCVVRGDGDLACGQALSDHVRGCLQRIYEGGRVELGQFQPARWDLITPEHYIWGSVQTVRGCSKHCSFCSVWRTDGQRPRQRASDPVIEEIVELRRRGFRFIALADDNFYPVSLTDIQLAKKQQNHARVAQLQVIREERFELMARLAELPSDLIFFTQITTEAAENPAFLEAMRRARIKGALVGVEAVTPEGLKAVFKDFNCSGKNLVQRLRQFQEHGVHVLGSFIFGLPTDREGTFGATEALAERAGLAFAQFVMLTPFAGTVDFERWERAQGDHPPEVEGVPITRYWLIPADKRPKMFMPHPTMGLDEMRAHASRVGSVLSCTGGLATLSLHAEPAGAIGVPVHLKAVSPNVCHHGHCDRQRPARTGQLVGQADCQDYPPLVSSTADATTASPTPEAGRCVQRAPSAFVVGVEKGGSSDDSKNIVSRPSLRSGRGKEGHLKAMQTERYRRLARIRQRIHILFL